MAWKRPSPRVAELIRQCAHIVVNAPAEWLDEIDRAMLAASPEIREDPVLAASVTRSNRANLFLWAAANVRDPASGAGATWGRADDHRARSGAPRAGRLRAGRLSGRAARGVAAVVEDRFRADF